MATLQEATESESVTGSPTVTKVNRPEGRRIHSGQCRKALNVESTGSDADGGAVERERGDEE